MSESSDNITSRNEARDFREQAIRIVKASLEDIPAQHPLDLPSVFGYQRTTMGNTVPVSLFRTVRLLAFREVLGAKLAAAVLFVAGRNIGRRLEAHTLDAVITTLRDFSLGRIEVESRDAEAIVISIEECATCGGVPNIGESLCHFEGGLIAGSLEGVFAGPVEVTETKCFGLGDDRCIWEAKKTHLQDADTSDPLRLIIDLVGRSASAVDRSSVILQKNQELRETCSRLRESERLRKDLTEMVVHDLRVPLTTIMGAVHTLTEIMGPSLPSQQTELLSMALSSGDSLLQMINDLLDISKFEEQKITLRKRRVSLAQLVSQAISQVSMLSRRKRQKLIVSVPDSLPSVRVDAERVLRMLVNLMANAMRHTAAGGRISVSAAVCADGKAVQVSIKDNGEGIPGEYHARIFDKFVQVESHRSRKRSSSGLGLTFCKLVTEAHGGRIWVESEPGHGSTFHFTLPLS